LQIQAPNPFNVFDVSRATVITEEAEQWLTGYEYTVISHHALNLAAQSGCSAYDCEFVAVAKDVRVPVSQPTDRSLKTFPAVAVSRSAFGN